MQCSLPPHHYDTPARLSAGEPPVALRLPVPALRRQRDHPALLRRQRVRRSDQKPSERVQEVLVIRSFVRRR